MKFEFRYYNEFTLESTVKTIEADDRNEALEILAEKKEAEFKEKLAELSDINKYEELQKLQSECEYYLNVRTGLDKAEWGYKVGLCINKMKKIYNSLAYRERPYWLSPAKLDNYSKALKSA